MSVALSSIIGSANWVEILSDLHAFKLKHPECLNGFDLPTKNVINKALGKMSVSGDVGRGCPFVPFDITQWEIAVGQFRPVNQERLVWAHATVFPDKHPDLVSSVLMLLSPEKCQRCDRLLAVGSLVWPTGREVRGCKNLCIPCHQKLEIERERESRRLAKEQRRQMVASQGS